MKMCPKYSPDCFECECEFCIKKKIVKAGELLFTGPMIDHAMLYTMETELLVMSKNPRDQKTYEEDTVRIDFMDHSKRF